MRISDWSSDVCSSDLLAVLHQHAVQKGGDVGGTFERAVGGEMRAFEDDVIALPRTGRTRGVHQRRLPAIDGADRPVGIGRVLIAVEVLDFVALHAPRSERTLVGKVFCSKCRT